MNALLSPSTRRPPYAVASLFLVALADLLLFRSFGGPVGLPLPLFLAALALSAALCNRRTLGREAWAAGLLFAGTVLALVENISTLSIAVALLCLAAFALAAAGRRPVGLALVGRLLRFLASGPFACLGDARRRRRAKRRRARSVAEPSPRSFAGAVWIMPLLLAGGFVLLLGAGNPIVGQWLAAIDLPALLACLDPVRLSFWVLALAFVWPFLRPRIRSRKARAKSWSRPAPPNLPATADGLALREAIFGAAAILRALLIFNAVFAVETILDVVYLWGGARLPPGIGYAAYVHRGAYTLVATAILAALFVLLALRPGTAACGDRRIRMLVYLWIGQNVVLVLSAMLRLDLYVDAYALTHWRVAAFLWMALVACGLVLIVARIALERSSRWLVGTNLTTAAVLLYACCFADVEAYIARFNVEHSREMTGVGAHLDLDHLSDLGPAAVPAIDTLLAALEVRPVFDPSEFDRRLDLRSLRDELVSDYRRLHVGWRQWTFRDWRLFRYLDARDAGLALRETDSASGHR